MVGIICSWTSFANLWDGSTGVALGVSDPWWIHALFVPQLVYSGSFVVVKITKNTKIDSRNNFFKNSNISFRMSFCIIVPSYRNWHTKVSWHGRVPCTEQAMSILIIHFSLYLFNLVWCRVISLHSIYFVLLSCFMLWTLYTFWPLLILLFTCTFRLGKPFGDVLEITKLLRILPLVSIARYWLFMIRVSRFLRDVFSPNLQIQNHKAIDRENWTSVSLTYNMVFKIYDNKEYWR